ncbi:RNA polymerase sigma factor [Sphingobacterium faecale]|uniref:RNA polymerase sigma factor n=1 Tax=Sphingobacterium faecale TaxID=2803775 RepID=A0ABS1R7P8_9SPHI|nr:RNA polymerase sigma factor [Sphingobacterium faecale]MBL1410731.1 RNA polymerase sigma factor [Sphingobacterium faecale]
MDNQRQADLLRDLQADSYAAFYAIYDDIGPIIASKLLQIVKDPSIVEDLHQETFLKLWALRRQIPKDTNLRAYTFTIAKNLSIDFFRKVAKDRKLQNEIFQHLTVTYEHVDALIQAQENNEILQQILNLLPPQRKQVFLQIKMEGKSYQEVADYYGVSLSTVKDHMAKAMKLVKTQLSSNHLLITALISIKILFR